MLETASGTRAIEAAPDNHFVNALLTFHAAMGTREAREALYQEILLQSKSLALIKQLGLPHGSAVQ